MIVHGNAEYTRASCISEALPPHTNSFSFLFTLSSFAKGYTKEPVFLDYAKNVSEYYLAAAEADLIPKWDFDAPQGQYRDTSSAAITASAFLELSTYLDVRLCRE